MVVLIVFKVIVAGGRDFDDYELLKNKLDILLQNKTEVTIVSGAARGADKLGERYAKERGYAISSYPAKWNKYGNSAGYVRNREMAKFGDALVAFWDGKSKGTRHMINLAKEEALMIRVIHY